MKPEAKRCPFCGGAGREQSLGGDHTFPAAGDIIQLHATHVRCQDCDASGPVDSRTDADESAQVAIAAWNKRQPERPSHDTKPKLSACPFCGCEARETISKQGDKQPSVQIWCDECGAQSAWKIGATDAEAASNAADAWNRRVN